MATASSTGGTLSWSIRYLSAIISAVAVVFLSGAFGLFLLSGNDFRTALGTLVIATFAFRLTRRIASDDSEETTVDPQADYQAASGRERYLVIVAYLLAAVFVISVPVFVIANAVWLASTVLPATPAVGLSLVGLTLGWTLLDFALDIRGKPSLMTAGLRLSTYVIRLLALGMQIDGTLAATASRELHQALFGGSVSDLDSSSRA